MDIVLLNVPTFLGGKLFHKIALITFKGVYLFSEPNQILITLIGLRRATPETETFAESYSGKFHKFHRKETLMKSFLEYLQPQYQYKHFLMTFAKFWRILLNSCFKEIANKIKVANKVLSVRAQ